MPTDILGWFRLPPETLLLGPSSVNDGYPGGRHIPGYLARQL